MRNQVSQGSDPDPKGYGEEGGLRRTMRVGLTGVAIALIFKVNLQTSVFCSGKRTRRN
jgi:hypothetical protein